MPMIMAMEKPRITATKEVQHDHREQGHEAGHGGARQGFVDRTVHDLDHCALTPLAEVLADAVQHDHSIVNRVADHRQHRRQHGQVEFNLKQREPADGKEHVMHGRGDAHRQTPFKAEHDVDLLSDLLIIESVIENAWIVSLSTECFLLSIQHATDRAIQKAHREPAADMLATISSRICNARLPLPLLVMALLVEEDPMIGRVFAQVQAPVGGSRPVLGMIEAALSPLDGGGWAEFYEKWNNILVCFNASHFYDSWNHGQLYAERSWK